MHVTIGIDIGGTNTKFGLVDMNGDLLANSTMPTPHHSTAKAYLTLLCEEIEKLLSHQGGVVLKGIGVGAPGVHPFTGKVADAANLPWMIDMDIKQSLESFYQLPVCVDNDANAAVMGEMKFGAAQKMSNIIVITLGTGLGSGIMVNGHLLYGHTGLAGEIGHTIIERGGRVCACGKRGCLETYVSGQGIQRTVAALLAEEYGPSELRKLPYQALTGQRIAVAAHNGDAIARLAFGQMGTWLGEALADTVAHLQPEAIFMAGGLTMAADLWLPVAKETFQQSLLGRYKNQVALKVSSLPANHAAVLGASALVMNELSLDMDDLDEMTLAFR